jgi:hypothetical protein
LARIEPFELAGTRLLLPGRIIKTVPHGFCQEESASLLWYYRGLWWTVCVCVHTKLRYHGKFQPGAQVDPREDFRAHVSVYNSNGKTCATGGARFTNCGLPPVLPIVYTWVNPSTSGYLHPDTHMTYVLNFYDFCFCRSLPQREGFGEAQTAPCDKVSNTCNKVPHTCNKVPHTCNKVTHTCNKVYQRGYRTKCFHNCRSYTACRRSIARR